MAKSIKFVIFARFLCGFATGILGGPGQVSDPLRIPNASLFGVRSHATPGTVRDTSQKCSSDPLTVIEAALNYGGSREVL